METKKIGGQYILETSCIVDTGANISYTTDEVRDALGRAPLTDANGGVTGVGGVHRGKEKDKLRVVTTDKQINICESRKVGDLGVNGNVNKVRLLQCDNHWVELSWVGLSCFVF